jgi:hypothetical protein
MILYSEYAKTFQYWFLNTANIFHDLEQNNIFGNKLCALLKSLTKSSFKECPSRKKVIPKGRLEMQKGVKCKAKWRMWDNFLKKE